MDCNSKFKVLYNCYSLLTVLERHEWGNCRSRWHRHRFLNKEWLWRSSPHRSLAMKNSIICRQVKEHPGSSLFDKSLTVSSPCVKGICDIWDNYHMGYCVWILKLDGQFEFFCIITWSVRWQRYRRKCDSSMNRAYNICFVYQTSDLHSTDIV
jgi:hypothetical protein